ncbi:DNA polymerase I alpha catalytic subunit,putative [Leishmania mexicana MHOM/GT/2001/U1103]|uniref:DNA polymerase n=1 Tax=Leishmania mexicana (strain MHOM/GT/2001/U1103) TaxID=929439 RepID=E9AQW7_LEIMU|nr:DNA polymerase I alpha catalytic subunit,putative [Leishmania mexicana MHOM/GT/2001/U1103]CBZ25338.1 DNA polymerase I alpha catalytic subunit,putative [Leishmania mexicana MHOM/GT/2001/U1103]
MSGGNDGASWRPSGKPNVPNFDETQEDQWRSLREELLQSDEDENIPESGDLAIPQLPSAKKAGKKLRKPLSGAKPTPKPKQQTLAQSMSDMDMERLLKRYRIDEDADVAEDIGVSHLLQPHSDSDDGGDEQEATLTADEFLARLARAEAVPAASIVKEKRESGEKTTVVALKDESFNFERDRSAKPLRPKPTPGAGDGAGYRNEETPKQAIELAATLAPQTDAAQFVSPAVPYKSEEMTEGLFYWFDAREQPHTLSVDPGSLFLFGKMAVEKNGRTSYLSCCVRVRNMYRSIFVLPKAGSSQQDVVKEINDICRNQGIEQRRIKFVERYYAFEVPGVPHEKTQWAKLRYPGRYPPLNAKGPFRHILIIMGASSSLLELFLIKRKLKGPNFLRISGLVASANRISHCALEFSVESPKNLRVEDTKLPVPPFTLASIQIHTQLDSKGACNEILIASVAIYKDVNIENTIRYIPDNILTGVRPASMNTPLPIDLESYCNAKGLPGVRRFANERALLDWLAQQLGKVDADMMIGHNFLGFTLDILLRRYQELSISSWSTIGRLDLKRLPRFQGTAPNVNQEKETCIGRLVVDSYSLSREHYKTVNYRLLSLADQMQLQGIAKGSNNFEPGTSVLTPAMLSASRDIYDVLLQVCNCAVLSTAVVSHLDVIRLTKRLTTIAGNLWSRTLFGARSERIEYLLLHTFHDLKFITPDRYVQDFKRGRDDDEEEDGKRKAKYQGGMVLDPKCGLYSDYILLLDFNSLYPSLIQEFNICFTTVDRENRSEIDVPPPENLICASCAAEGLSAPCLHKSVLPKVIKSLVDSRREVKRLMKTEKDANNLALLEIRQKALKLTANSMYGCLGFEHSRFHAQPLAELVTRQGRLALQSTVDLIPQLNPSLRVIYGDTDSVMIQTGIKNDIKAVRDLGLDLKAKINKRYQSLEIDIDGVFRAILLLKKKKYAALTVTDWQGEGKTYKKEVKGLDMVRRDWCPLSKCVCDAVLSRVLNAEGSEDILDYVMNYMRDVAEQVRAGRYTLDNFVISKSLTKEPEAYRGNSFPHATVALRMKQRKELVRVGDLIPYVICTGDRLSDKAFHVEEVRQNSQLHIDSEWYLSVQIYPPVMRLCEHIQGFSNAQLSEAMGIACHTGAKLEEEEAGTMNDFSHSSLFQSRNLEECFPAALPLQVACTHCRLMTPINPHTRVMEVLADQERQRDRFDLYVCVSCRKSLPVEYVANCFTQTCYGIIRQFYQCGGSAAAVKAVRTQFTYYRALFDVPHAPGCPARVKDAHYYQARRCLGVDRRLYTLAEAADPAVQEVADPVDPLNAAAETIYKRIDHLFINLDSLFAGI